MNRRQLAGTEIFSQPRAGNTGSGTLSLVKSYFACMVTAKTLEVSMYHGKWAAALVKIYHTSTQAQSYNR